MQVRQALGRIGTERPGMTGPPHGRRTGLSRPPGLRRTRRELRHNARLASDWL